MDELQGFLIVGLALLLVILFNLAIYFGYARKNTPNEFHYLQKTMKQARNPWQEEDATLEELSRRVASLQSSPSENDRALSQTKQTTDQ